MTIPKCDSVVVACANGCGTRIEVSPRRALNPVCCCEDCEFQWCGESAVEAGEKRVADHIDGYDRDDLGESPDW